MTQSRLWKADTSRLGHVQASPGAVGRWLTDAKFSDEEALDSAAGRYLDHP